MNLNSNTISKGRLICLFFVLIFASCKKPQTENKLEGEALGTTFHIIYLGEEIEDLNNIIDSMHFAFNHALSTYQSNSLISEFNSNTLNTTNSEYNQNEWNQFKKMISLSQKISTSTRGAFDPSAAALYAIYDKAKKANALMDSFDVQHALLHQGMGKIVFDTAGTPIKMDSLVSINFNAIAKGYFVDILSDYLELKGCENYLVEVGGEVRVKGKNSTGKLWSLGINVPEIDANPMDYFNVLQLENTAIATSGNYQNYYTVNNQLIGHTIDPRTGSAIISNLKSVSVMHNHCSVADAYATACMVLGLEESIKIINADSSLSAYFIYEENNELKGLHLN